MKSSDSPLTGRVFDDRGNRMTPTYATKDGVRYRYYVSSVLFQGRRSEVGLLSRIPAVEVETLIANAVRQRLQIRPDGTSDRDLIQAHVKRVNVAAGSLKITLTVSDDVDPNDDAEPDGRIPAENGRGARPRYAGGRRDRSLTT